MKRSLGTGAVIFLAKGWQWRMINRIIKKLEIIESYLLFLIGELKLRNWEGNGNPLQYSCLENPKDRGAWWAAIYGVAQSQTRLKWLSSSSIKIKKRMLELKRWAMGKNCSSHYIHSLHISMDPCCYFIISRITYY